MSESINLFIHTDEFIIIFSIIAFINVWLMVIVSLLIGRSKYIKKMDIVFLGYSPDYGIWLNSYRAFAYGMSMLFPGSLGKRIHKNIDISIIDRKDKLPYMFYTSLFLFLIPIFLIAALY